MSLGQLPIASAAEAERAVALMEKFTEALRSETAHLMREGMALESAKQQFARLCSHGRTDQGGRASDRPPAAAASGAAPPLPPTATAAAAQHDRAGDRAFRVGRNHPWRLGRAGEDPHALHLWRDRPDQYVQSAHGAAACFEPHALIQILTNGLRLTALSRLA
jgi:hypothetical protein